MQFIVNYNTTISRTQMILCNETDNLLTTMNEHKILGPPRKRKKACVDYYDVEDIAPTTTPARTHQVHVHEWKGTGAASAYQSYTISPHSSQLPESHWYSSLFPSAVPTPPSDESWSINDDVISQYDPVLDEQLPVRPGTTRVRVSLSKSLSETTNLDDCLTVN
jgi:hypothetical protein